VVTNRSSIQSSFILQYIKFKVDVGLLYLIDAVKAKKISIFLQIWTRKCVYISQLICTWCDSMCPCQNMHRNAPGSDFKFPEYLR